MLVWLYTTSDLSCVLSLRHCIRLSSPVSNKHGIIPVPDSASGNDSTKPAISDLNKMLKSPHSACKSEAGASVVLTHGPCFGMPRIPQKLSTSFNYLNRIVKAYLSDHWHTNCIFFIRSLAYKL